MIDHEDTKPARPPAPLKASAPEPKDPRSADPFVDWVRNGVRLSDDGSGSWTAAYPLRSGAPQGGLAPDGDPNSEAVPSK